MDSALMEEITMSGLSTEARDRVLEEALDPFTPWEGKELGGSLDCNGKPQGIPIVKDRLVRELVSGKSLEQAIYALKITSKQWMLATWPEFGNTLGSDDLKKVVIALRRKGCVAVMIFTAERDETPRIDMLDQLLKEHGILPLICTELLSWKLIKEGRTHHRIIIRGIDDLLSGNSGPYSSLVCQVPLDNEFKCIMGRHTVKARELAWFKTGSKAKAEEKVKSST